MIYLLHCWRASNNITKVINGFTPHLEIEIRMSGDRPIRSGRFRNVDTANGIHNGGGIFNLTGAATNMVPIKLNS